MVIVNLTQHQATTEQIAQGVADLPEREAHAVRDLLTFDAIPQEGEIMARARDIALIAATALGGDEGDIHPQRAMIGGAPYLMGALENALIEQGIIPCYAFSTREVLEQTQADGTVRKTAVFRHAGFVVPPSIDGQDAYI